MRKSLTVLVVALVGSACGPPIVELEVDVRLTRAFLESVEGAYPIAIDIDVEVPRTPVLLRSRADILCGPEAFSNDVRIVTLRLDGVRCRPGVNVRAYVFPVDLRGFECEDLSLNGRQSLSFDSDLETLLGEAQHEGVFEQGRAPCRDGTEIATMTIDAD